MTSILLLPKKKKSLKSLNGETDGTVKDADAVTKKTSKLDSVDAISSEAAEYLSDESSELDKTFLNTDGSVNLAVMKSSKEGTAAGRLASLKVVPKPVTRDADSTSKAIHINNTKNMTKD